MSRSRSLLALLLAVAIGLVALGAYWWWSPQLVLHQMQRAGARGDLDALSAHVDYPAVRDSLRAQFTSALPGNAGAPSDNPLAALGSALGAAFVGPLVDVMIRPQTLASALQTGRVRPGGSSVSTEPVEWQLQRDGDDRAVFQPHRPGEAVDANATAFVFLRHGFADWKLSEIRMHLDR